MTDYVYAIRNTQSRTVKIGSANNPNKRLQTLRTGCDAKLELIAAVECSTALAVEKQVHFELSEFRCAGEWFRLTAL